MKNHELNFRLDYLYLQFCSELYFWRSEFQWSQVSFPRPAKYLLILLQSVGPQNVQKLGILKPVFQKLGNQGKVC